MQYYSDQVNGGRVRDVDEIGPSVWAGILALINSKINDGSFASVYPKYFHQSTSCIESTDKDQFFLACSGEVPNIKYPLSEFSVPATLDIIDLVQFCWTKIAMPTRRSHDFYDHDHLVFDIEAGRSVWVCDVNRIFARNGIAYKLGDDGCVTRLLPEIFIESFDYVLFRTDDSILNGMLADACGKFINPNEKIRREGLERLWDAWERIKTINDSDKKQSVKELLDKCATESELRKNLEDEAATLTKIGNKFLIRHSERNKVPLERSTQVDYLFYRLFSLIHLAIKSL